MRKLYLSVISLGLCLILGFGSLAAQKGKKKEPQTTFAVTVVAGTIGLPSGGVWWLPDCVGLAEGSNLEASSFENCDPIGLTSGEEVFLSQISTSQTGKKVRLHIFFRDKLRVVYQTDDISLPPGAVENVSYTAFDVMANSKDVPIRTAFDVVVNAIDVPIRQEGQGKPGTGPIVAMINVGRVSYIEQPTP